VVWLSVGKSWLFAGSERGVDPQAWLADVLARIADIPQKRLSELLPWNWRSAAKVQNAA
jgi:transposase